MNELYQIEKGTPVPSRNSHSGKLMMALKQMEVGDSMIVPLKVRTFVYTQANRQLGFKLKYRRIDDSTGRLWRIK
jgi:hypothetical protein